MSSTVHDIPGVRDVFSDRVRVAIYARTSADPHKLGRPTEAQVKDVRAGCDRPGWYIVGVFVDDDRSASEYAKLEREEYARLMALVASGGTDIVAAWETSRLWRNMDEFLPARKLCRDLGVLIWIDGVLYDMRVARDRAALTREVQAAEEEADRIQARAARTTRQRAARGGVHGRLAFGYRRRYDPVTRELVEQYRCPETAPVVEEIVGRVAAGHPLLAIARDLDARGIKTPTGKARWNPATVRAIARNPVYIGVRVHNGERVAGQWPPIVERDVHAAAVAVLADPERRTQRGTAAKYLLTGLVRCGVDGCGARMHRVNGTLRSSGRAHPQYRCRTCQRPAIPQEDLENWVVEHLLCWLEAPGRWEKILAGLGQEQAARALVELREAEAELAVAYSLAEAGELSARGLALVERQQLPVMERARRQVEMARVPSELRRFVGPGAREVWASDAVTMVERRSLLQQVMLVEVLEGVRGVRSARQMSRRVRITWLLGEGSS